MEHPSSVWPSHVSQYFCTEASHQSVPLRTESCRARGVQMMLASRRCRGAQTPSRVCCGPRLSPPLAASSSPLAASSSPPAASSSRRPRIPRQWKPSPAPPAQPHWTAALNGAPPRHSRARLRPDARSHASHGAPPPAAAWPRAAPSPPDRVQDRQSSREGIQPGRRRREVVPIR
jgi:hypothetical protein